MATIIRIKRSGTAGNPATLAAGEMAYSFLAGGPSNGGDRLYIGTGTEVNGDAANHEVIGGKYFTNMLDHTPGALTASSALIVDSNGKLNLFKVDNIQLDSSTIATLNNGALKFNQILNMQDNKVTNLGTPSAGSDAATKAYVDGVIGGDAIELSIAGNSGSGDVTLADSELSIVGGTGLTSTASGAQVSIALDNTAVTPASYGSSTAIPTFTVDQQGRLTAAGTAPVSSTLTVAGSENADSAQISLIDSSLTFATGTGLDVSVSGTTVTYSAELASTSNIGAASFSSSNFNVTTGAVSSKDITIGSTALTLGETTTTLAGLTQIDVDNMRILDNTIASTSGTLFIDPTPIGSDSGSVIIRGDLQVNGTTTTINSTTVAIGDKTLNLADSADNATEADGAGITIGSSSYSSSPQITFDGSTNRWDPNRPLDIPHASLDSAVFLNGVGLGEVIEDHVANTFLQAGEAMDLTYVDGSGTLTLAVELATTSNIGAASFDSDNFTVTSGDVAITQVDGGTF